jgi:hypothetical protein
MTEQLIPAQPGTILLFASSLGDGSVGIKERPVIAWCCDKEGLVTMPVVPGPFLQREHAPFADVTAIEINGKLWRLFDNFDCVWPLKSRRDLIATVKAKAHRTK